MENFEYFDKERLIINKNLINYIEVYDNNIRIHTLGTTTVIRRDFKNRFSVYKWLIKNNLIKECQTVQVFKDIAEHNREMKAQEKLQQKEIENASNNPGNDQQ